MDIPSCSDLADSLESEGQLQPILVRTVGPLWPSVPLGHYQIVFGERRWRAAQIAGWESIEAEIAEDMDDATSLRLMAIENAKRKDLNPIEQARALKNLCDPPEVGGGGMTRAEAAAIFGLQTGPAATNKIRLLELPDVWQQRVAAGELPETAARELLPYVGAKRVMAAIDKEYRTAKDRYGSRDELQHMARWVTRQNVRRIDGKPEWHNSIMAQTKCLIELTDEVRKELDVATVLLDGKQVEVAQNPKLFDELQKEAWEAKQAKAKKAAAKTSDAKRSPAEAKKLAEQQAEQLGRRIHAWKQLWIRKHIALASNVGDWQITKLLMWSSAGSGSTGHCMHEGRADALENEMLRLGGKFDRWDRNAWKTLSAVGTTADAWNLFVHNWAVTLLTGRPGGEPAMLPDEVVDGLAADYALDVAELWRADQANNWEVGRERLRPFFELHQMDQLQRLADELGVSIDAAKKKSGAIGLIMGRMESGRLPLPSSLGGAKKGRKRK